MVVVEFCFFNYSHSAQILFNMCFLRGKFNLQYKFQKMIGRMQYNCEKVSSQFVELFKSAKGEGGADERIAC